MTGLQKLSFARAKYFIIAAAGILLAACATSPEVSRDLQNAREAYQQAAGMQIVEQNAPVALKEAREALEKAEQAEEENMISHFAYLAQKRSQLAIELAQQQAARQRVESLEQERQALRLQVRERQTERARQEVQEQEKAAAEARQQVEQARQQAEQARQQVSQLEEQVSTLKAEKTERGTVFTLEEKDVFFEVGKAELEPGAMRQISKLANLVQRYPDRKIVVEGYTDATGPAELNEELSRRRAESVAEVLVAQGVDRDRIVTRGYGENFPVASNNTQAGRLQNRRVEIVLLRDGATDTQRQQ